MNEYSDVVDRMNSIPGQEAVILDVNTNNLNELTPQSGFSVYQIIGIIVIFTIVASVVSYSRHLFIASYEQTKNWLFAKVPFLNRQSTPEPVGGSMLNFSKLIYPNAGDAAQPTVSESTNSVSPPEPEPAASADQTWCLVGEDMAGRWCVQVPSIKACDQDRTYSSRNKCEKGK
jgi:hypothetical protein